MYVARVIGTDIQVCSPSMLEAYNTLRGMVQSKYKISVRYYPLS